MPVVLETRDDVHVRMEDRLPGSGAVVHGEVHAVRRDAALERVRDEPHRVHHGVPFGFVYLKNVGRVLFRDDERVARVHRIDVEEGDGLFVLVQDVRGEAAFGDSAEKTVRHACSIAQDALWRPVGYHCRMTGVSELVIALLRRRGIETEEARAAFLNPDFVRDTHDPFLLPNMERAVGRILTGVAGGERIAVYADFDCDGIPGAVVLHDFFKKIGHANIEIYIPHRDREGYGYHAAAIDELVQRGTSLVITVDVGTTARDAVSYAKKHGIETIVTDHHEIQEASVPECIVVNPKLKTPLGAYPFPDLCGAAVAWKLVSALLREGRRRGIESFASIPEGWEKWLLDMVGIATVADMVPLVGENRALAHFGLAVLRKSPRPGLRALLSLARVSQAVLTEDDIGFALAPRLNAASRMGEPEIAFRLLATSDPREAEVLARHLDDLNKSRKGIVGTMVREAKRRARARFTSEKVVVLGDASWSPSLLGLAANSLMEERGGIVCLWGRDSMGRIRGSCRSDGSLSVMELFMRAEGVFDECGGHTCSGGFSVSQGGVHTLHESLSAVAEGLTEGERTRIDPDADLPLKEVTFELLGELSRLAPFGIGNPKPLVRFSRVRVLSVRAFGKEKNHVEAILSDARGVSCRAFEFFKTPDSFTTPLVAGSVVDILATIERDSFRGSRAIALRLADILPFS